MSSSLFDLGRLCFRHARATVGVWVFLVVLLGAGMGLLSRGTTEVYTVPGSQGQQAIDDLKGRFPELSGAAAQIVVEAPAGRAVTDATTRTDVEALIDRVKDVHGVAAVADPYDEKVEGALGTDHRAALVNVQLDEEATEVDPTTLTSLEEAVGPLRAKGYTAEVGGGAFMSPPPTISAMEAVGLAVAMIVLLLTFRSVRAAALPLVSALAGAAVTATIIMIATAVVDIPGTAPLLALMIGVAVGIDYALFILARHREQLATGVDAEESAGLAVATAGGAVVFAGLTVLIALLGLTLAGLPFLSRMGVSASLGVAIAVLAAITLLPALMGLLGDRLTPRSMRRGHPAEGAEEADPAEDDDTHADVGHTGDVVDSGVECDAGEDAGSGTSHAHESEHSVAATRVMDTPVPGNPASTSAPSTSPTSTSPTSTSPTSVAAPRGAGWARAWVRVVTAVPALTLAVVTALLVALSLPALGLRLALPDNGSMAPDSSPRRAYDLVAEHFGAGANGPLLVTADIIASNDPRGLVDDLKAEIEKVPGVERVQLATPNRTADTGVFVLVPRTGPMDARTADLVRDLRDRLPALEKKYDTSLAVTGHTAIQIDVSERLARATMPFALVVMGLSLVLLMIVFRSLIVPLTATLGFVLSTTAAFGVVAAVFEYGWFADVLDVPRLGPVISFMPIIVMGVLFGLAMDYQVFLVSRMRETYVRGADAQEAVRLGFASSGPVVAAAAAIMVAVFASFVPHADANLKPIALGLATGVLLDALVVRMIAIPAVLALCGRATWAFPAALDRALPHVDVEGAVVQDHLERTRELREHPQRLVEVSDLDVRGAYGPVVSGLDLHIDEPGVCVVQGPDGSGKTSVLLAVAGRMPFRRGLIEVGGHVLPEQAGAVQRLVALSEMRGINDLDDALSLSNHIAERLSVRTLLPWARRGDIDRVMDRFTAALVAARRVRGAVVPRTEIDPSWVVGELSGVEREIFGVVLALVENPRLLVIDENGELRSDADRAAVMAAVGYLMRAAQAEGRPLSVLGASTQPIDPDRLARLGGTTPEHVSIVPLSLTRRAGAPLTGIPDPDASGEPDRPDQSVKVTP